MNGEELRSFSSLTLFSENYYFTKKITNLRRKSLICEEKSRVKVQKSLVKVQKSVVKVQITHLRRKLLICKEKITNLQRKR